VQRFSKSIVLAALTRAQQLTRGPVKRQATAIGMLLRFLRLSVLAFAVGEGHVQRFVAEVSGRAMSLGSTSGYADDSPSQLPISG